MRWRPEIVLTLALLVTAACERTEPKAPPRDPVTTALDARRAPAAIDAGAPADAAAAPLACDQRDRAGCLAASGCTLVPVAPLKYACRDEAGPCEVGIDQRDSRACEAVAGCVWDPGACYCAFPGYGATAVPDRDPAGGQACGCGGGPPPSCHQ